MVKKLLVVVDMQNDFIDGTLGFKKALAVVPTVVAKIEAAAKDPDCLVVVTYDTHEDHYLETREGKALPVLHCVENTPGWALNKKVASALKKYNASRHKDLGYIPLKKPSFGIDQSGMALLFEKLALRKDNFEDQVPHIETIEVCGLVSNICVLSNVVVFQANFPHAQMVVDEKATASFDDGLNQSTLDVLRGLQVALI